MNTVLHRLLRSECFSNTDPFLFSLVGNSWLNRRTNLLFEMESCDVFVMSFDSFNVFHGQIKNEDNWQLHQWSCPLSLNILTLDLSSIRVYYVTRSAFALFAFHISFAHG
jgi:hypothetical protein